MKKLSYLTVTTLVLALVVLSCGQIAPTAQNEVVQQQEDEVVLPQSAVVPIAPGDCCPKGFVRDSDPGNPADVNGDNLICRKRVLENVITIDNNVPGECCTPPAC